MTNTKDKILEEIKFSQTFEWVKENYYEIVKIVQEELKKCPVKLSKIQNPIWHTWWTNENWADNFVEILITDICPNIIELEKLDIPLDLEYADGLSKLNEELEKMVDDLNSGNIKDINTFDLSDYMEIY